MYLLVYFVFWNSDGQTELPPREDIGYYVAMPFELDETRARIAEDYCDSLIEILDDEQVAEMNRIANPFMDVLI